MRKAPEEFVAKLQRFDPKLQVEWVHHNRKDVVASGRERWRIVRQHPDGRLRHVFFVQEPDGAYRGLDDRILEKLHRCDASRFYDADQMLAWFDANPDVDTKAKLEAMDFLERRYHDSVEELAERLASAVGRQDAHTTREESQRATDQMIARNVDKQAVDAAYQEGKGTIILGPNGWPIVGKE